MGGELSVRQDYLKDLISILTENRNLNFLLLISSGCFRSLLVVEIFQICISVWNI